MSAWTKIVTQPLGLAGFALFLAFSYVGRIKAMDKRRWPAVAAFLGAAIALVGGLGLASLQVPRPVAQPAPVSTVIQSGTGDCSPNLDGNEGVITMTCGTPPKPAISSTAEANSGKAKAAPPASKGK